MQKDENENGYEKEKVQSETEIFYTAQKTKCNNEHCIEVKCMLESQIKNIQVKKQNNKEAIQTCLEIITQKNIEIAALKKNIELLNCPTKSSGTSVSVCNANSSAAVAVQQKETLDFIEFARHFTENQLSDLRSFRVTKSEDSTFVSLALRSLYEDKLETLQTETVTGRGYRGMEKKKMTPEKVEIIGKLLENRSNMSAKCSICGERRQFQKGSIWNLKSHLEKVRLKFNFHPSSIFIKFFLIIIV